MASETGKELLFSADQFMMLIAWLAMVFGILYFGMVEYVLPAIVAFIAINAAVFLWMNRIAKPVRRKGYKKYLVMQTLFLIVWSPVLLTILGTGKQDLVSMWVVILVAFYIGIGLLSGREMALTGKKGK